MNALIVNNLTFNWIISGDDNPSLKKARIDLEYRLRPRITKFLLSQLDGDHPIDFSSFYFDVDLKNQWIWISERTPRDIVEKIKVSFDQEINGSHLFSVA
ncbi:hypothetical protein [Flagellimonas onchidii]|uniref:hypothetical protein n=1 Tax=Flagellimonas onchidii TaxID=2562684 RepID=UPI00197AA62C|nr:hypothetical protein [Allomuricauda onchidii]